MRGPNGHNMPAFLLFFRKGTRFTWCGDAYIVKEVRPNNPKPILAKAEETKGVEIYAFSEELLRGSAAPWSHAILACVEAEAKWRDVE
jgi:hypothetical protein